MPYIEQHRRDAIDKGEAPDNAGELNYRLTVQVLSEPDPYHNLSENLLKICERYLERKGVRYQYINDVLGACDGAARELHRRMVGKRRYEQLILRNVAHEIYLRVAAPYEDEKIKTNGDIPY